MYVVAKQELSTSMEEAYPAKGKAFKQSLKLDRLGLHATRLQIETLLEDIRERDAVIDATNKSFDAARNSQAALLSTAQSEWQLEKSLLNVKLAQLERDKSVLVAAAAETTSKNGDELDSLRANIARVEQQLVTTKKLLASTREELIQARDAARVADLRLASKSALPPDGSLNASNSSQNQAPSHSMSLSSPTSQINPLARHFEHFNSVVSSASFNSGRNIKVQAMVRGYLGRLRVRRLQVLVRARLSGVLVALKDTEQGETGWYVAPDGAIYYFVLTADKSNWIATAGPIDFDTFEKLNLTLKRLAPPSMRAHRASHCSSNSESKSSEKNSKSGGGKSPKVNAASSSSDKGLRLIKAAPTPTPVPAPPVLTRCPFDLAVEHEELNGELFIGSSSTLGSNGLAKSYLRMYVVTPVDTLILNSRIKT